MMKPSNIEIMGGEYDLTHKCLKCGHEKRNKMSLEDDFEKVLKI